jgi:hypothetical protein
VNPKPYNGYVDTPLLGKATTAKRRVCGEDKPTGCSEVPYKTCHSMPSMRVIDSSLGITGCVLRLNNVHELLLMT